MVRLRSSGYLSCFYCGKKSATRFDGVTRNFDCVHCDATNYLDENGDITDPPVATEAEAPRFRPRSNFISDNDPPSSTPSESIFCDTCLKNQRLFTASLAQYFSDDPDGVESDELDHKYYAFRRGLEQRYPQVCAQCADRVNSAIERAGYTAKTDHLRKMMERSRDTRIVRKTRTGLDWVNFVGWLLWWSGLAVQMIWHLKMISVSFSRSDNGMKNPDSGWWEAALENASGMLPSGDSIIRMSLICATLSVWWNPHLVQVVRGFTKHLLGIGQWYSFQVLIVVSRFAFRSVLKVETLPKNAQLSAHLVMAASMMLVYTLASRSISLDTTPLFAPRSRTTSPKQLPLKKQQQERRRGSSLGNRSEHTKSFAEILNEALDSPTITPSKSQQRQYTSRYSPSPPVNSLFGSNRSNQNNEPFSVNALRLCDASPPQPQYGDQMDWSPTPETHSKHRAFRQSPSTANRAFGQAPTQEKSGPFWYKVPQAPINPAHKLRNPPNQPSLRAKHEPKGENIFFRGGRKDDQGAGREQAGVTFQQPKFFAQSSKSDDANKLADLLGQSFSLGQDTDPTFSPAKPSSSSSSVDRNNTVGKPVRVLPWDIFAIASLFVMWLLTVALPPSVAGVVEVSHVRFGILALAGIVCLQACPSRSDYGLVVSFLEMAGLCWVGWGVYSGVNVIETIGGGVLAAMCGHSVWDGRI